ncbi:Enolase-phosphatase E1 [Atta colombica]|uniref:Enolase-phosphatase E1 n=1 Tax=Atta colombica TaxID=520822 RepID=A0A195AYQ4_9HYME|nr:PREDICTED: enolase-phosphatase E1 [Atta colombica]KYM77170.1 Enolase-phosphatase E1 [Atta colombica]
MAGEKRSQDQDEISLAKTVLIDIEGTTTSISFVKETLFPYVRQNLKDYIETKWEDEEFKQDYEKLKEQAKKDEEEKLEGFAAITGDKSEEEKDSLLKNVLWQMDNDRKTAALKQLQGHMWREAYKTGTIKGHIYEDVPKAIESWTNNGQKIYVYSSGSVEAQKLLFEYSIHGDLLKYFNGFFDTEIGAKQESDSYKNILSKISENPSDVVFLTDVVKEAAAAKEAGLSTVIVVREGNAPLTDEENVTYTTIKSFLDLTFQSSTKRQKIETTDDKVDEGTADVSEPMDTSEDVEMSNVSDKKVEKNDAKEVTESIEKECAKDQPSESTSISSGQVKESAVDEKDVSNTEQKITESNVKSEESINEESGSSENTKSDVKDDVTPATKDNDKDIAEKTEENLDTTATEITTAADDSMDVSVPESASKSETTITSSEKKIEDSTDVTKDTQAEDVDKTETIKSDEKADNIVPQSQTCDKNIANKSEECVTAKKDEVKEESKIVSDTSESENILAKSEQEVTKMEIAVDVTENGEVTETATEKTTVSEAVTETEETVTDVRKEATVSIEVSAEKSSEIIAESEKADEKVQTMETETTDADKCENETTQQETIKEEETVKEENVVDTKDKTTVDSEKQKLNGTTQNGNTDVPVLDDKLHSNGLNEGPSKETTNEDAAAQNGEPESLSESSAESIKVKKVVDSAVADGAGEPDVVPPVVVAATS